MTAPLFHKRSLNERQKSIEELHAGFNSGLITSIRKDDDTDIFQDNQSVSARSGKRFKADRMGSIDGSNVGITTDLHLISSYNLLIHRIPQTHASECRCLLTLIQDELHFNIYNFRTNAHHALTTFPVGLQASRHHTINSNIGRLLNPTLTHVMATYKTLLCFNYWVLTSKHTWAHIFPNTKTRRRDGFLVL